ncbi:hypothetical protein HDU67_002918 [Dinochytrium kinnereticum]|nr:hypothetical protein HDU67_002918 [Dinochytrium kinnereticum]
MDNYQRAPAPASEGASNIQDGPGTFRIQGAKKAQQYVPLVLEAIKVDKTVVVTASGKSINVAITVVELCKRQLGAGWQQVTEISSESQTDTWEPKEEGLDQLSILFC